MNPHLIMSLISYFNCETLTLCAVDQDKSIWEAVTAASTVHVIGCLEDSNTDSEKPSQEDGHQTLIVCENAMSCKNVFKRFLPGKRKDLIFFFSNNSLSWKICTIFAMMTQYYYMTSLQTTLGSFMVLKDMPLT